MPRHECLTAKERRVFLDNLVACQEASVFLADFVKRVTQRSYSASEREVLADDIKNAIITVKNQFDNHMTYGSDQSNATGFPALFRGSIVNIGFQPNETTVLDAINQAVSSHSLPIFKQIISAVVKASYHHALNEKHITMDSITEIFNEERAAASSKNFKRKDWATAVKKSDPTNPVNYLS